MRVIPLVLSLVAAGLPSWASALSCQHDAAQVQSCQQCDHGERGDAAGDTHPAPTGTLCPSSALCAFTSGALLSSSVTVIGAVQVSTAVVIPHAESFVSADALPPFRPPIA